ncbi:DUF2066 domain-containing protein [Methyloligella sp. 2.7D]|uniref:DUF2066 domain-containing protein n=1 Tax=unclassified Methyloligella TaxID=2625955 RepID=UPI00157D4B9B|nr:DUF2066 domain-containing protein [Methyloligella sp. GL2]QKP77259.1 DUF2066 domain-containing protein [Methyloligella sp. GL2]
MRYLVFLAGLGLALACAGPAFAASSLYDVDSIDVDVTASDAVAAQKKAMAEAQAKGADILLKRLVAPSDYAQLPKLSAQEIEGLVTGVSIQSERYSTTRYIATLGVSFSPPAVQQLLASRGLMINDQRAPEIKILPIVLNGQVQGDDPFGWYNSWANLDLSHGLAPATVVTPINWLTTERLGAILNGDYNAFQFLENQYGGGPLVIAIAELGSDPAVGQVLVTRLYGADSTGDVDSSQMEPIENGDIQAAALRAAQMNYSEIENRWKATTAQVSMQQQRPRRQKKRGGFLSNFFGGQEEQVAAPMPPPMPAAPPPMEMPAAAAKQNISATVEFAGLDGWQQMRQRLNSVPGVESLAVNSLSPNNAFVTFGYAGSMQAFEDQLAQNGFYLEQGMSGYVVRSY